MLNERERELNIYKYVPIYILHRKQSEKKLTEREEGLIVSLIFSL